MTRNKDRKDAIRALAEELGVSYSTARNRLDSPRRAEATLIREEKGWRLCSPDRPDGYLLGWRAAVPFDDRDTLIEQAGRHLGASGWDVSAWPARVAGTMTVPLARNRAGMQEDEAGRILADAGVDYSEAHYQYVYAVADTVAAMGLPVNDVNADGGEPREGFFRLGPGREDLRAEGSYGPSDIIAWDERRGWYHVFYSDTRKALGDYADDLPGGYLGMTARPEDVAMSVARFAGAAAEGQVLKAPLPWALPEDYDEDPPLAEEQLWEASARMERSLTAYIGLRAPDPAAVRTVGEDTVMSLRPGLGPLVDPVMIRGGVRERGSRDGNLETGPKEYWDYKAIGDGWAEECRYFLAAWGITWDRDARTVTVPAGMTGDAVAEAWGQALGRFGRWMDELIAEVRRGRPYAPRHKVRNAGTQGARWLCYEPGKAWDQPGELAAALEDAAGRYPAQPPLNRDPAARTPAMTALGYEKLMAAGEEALVFPTVYPGGAGAVVRDAVAALWPETVPDAAARVLVTCASRITGRGWDTGILDGWGNCPVAALMLGAETDWSGDTPGQAGFTPPGELAAALAGNPAYDAAVLHGTSVLLALVHQRDYDEDDY